MRQKDEKDKFPGAPAQGIGIYFRRINTPPYKDLRLASPRLLSYNKLGG
jgi:hypothetical protein